MINNIVFYMGLALLMVHEMDAVRRNEWKMFFYLSTFEHEKGFVIFSLIHIPLFFLILWGSFAVNPVFKHYLVLVLNFFFVVHFFLHLAFIRHRNNEFKSVFSWAVISGLFFIGMVGMWA